MQLRAEVDVVLLVARVADPLLELEDAPAVLAPDGGGLDVLGRNSMALLKSQQTFQQTFQQSFQYYRVSHTTTGCPTVSVPTLFADNSVIC